jgi:hypothetical protein
MKRDKTIVSAALLLIAIFIFYLFTKPISDPLKHTEIIGLKKIPLSDIRQALNNDEYKNQSLLSLKRSWIKEELKKNPLVQDVKVQGILLPFTKIRILIKEIPILAVLDLGKERVIFDTKGTSYKISPEKFSYLEKIFKNDGTAHKRTSSRLRRTNDRNVLQVHEDHEDDENAEIGVREQSPDTIPKIYAKSSFYTKENLHNLNAIIQHIEKAISSIGFDEKIHTIYCGPSENLRLTGNHFEYKIGKLSNRSLARVKRLDLALIKIEELLTKDKIDLKYIDLSLSTKEIILGKNE